MYGVLLRQSDHCGAIEEDSSREPPCWLSATGLLWLGMYEAWFQRKEGDYVPLQRDRTFLHVELRIPITGSSTCLRKVANPFSDDGSRVSGVMSHVSCFMWHVSCLMFLV